MSRKLLSSQLELHQSHSCNDERWLFAQTPIGSFLLTITSPDGSSIPDLQFSQFATTEPLVGFNDVLNLVFLNENMIAPLGSELLIPTQSSLTLLFTILDVPDPEACISANNFFDISFGPLTATTTCPMPPRKYQTDVSKESILECNFDDHATKSY